MTISQRLRKIESTENKALELSKKLIGITDVEIGTTFANMPDCWHQIPDGLGHESLTFNDFIYEREVKPVEFEYIYRKLRPILENVLEEEWELMCRFAEWLVWRLEHEDYIPQEKEDIPNWLFTVKDDNFAKEGLEVKE